MGIYKNFKEFAEDKLYNCIFKSVNDYISQNKRDFENHDMDEVSRLELTDIHVAGVTFKEGEEEKLQIRISVDADVDVYGYTACGWDHISTTKFCCVFLSAILQDGLRNIELIKIEDYEKNKYDKDSSLSQNLVSYMYEENVEKYAEAFLQKHCPQALLEPMAIPVFDIIQQMGMKMFYAPLENNVFGKTYFGKEKVWVYKDNSLSDTIEIDTCPGTMLINPNVYFMRNVGSVNNTIIHECVHWDRHRRPFELQKLLMGDCQHISCEIVERYDGLEKDSSALKWMEWQANQLAPRILMPAEMTKKKLNDCLNKLFSDYPNERNAVRLETAIEELADFFHVSKIAAKIRAIELGFDQVQGVFVYSNNEYLPPFSFPSGTLKSNQTFVLDEPNAIIAVYNSDDLRKLFFSGVLVYVNSMICVNSPKYVQVDETPKLTDYALNHVDECCYIFTQKIGVSKIYSDSFYRKCFLCRDVNSETYIEAEYDPEHKNNQDKIKQAKEIKVITDLFRDIANRLENEIPGGFAATLIYHMNRKGLTNEELSGRSYISTVSISGYRNDKKPSIDQAMALCNGLKLAPPYAKDLMKKAGYDLSNVSRKNLIITFLLDYHMDDTIEQWQEKINTAELNLSLPKETQEMKRNKERKQKNSQIIK